MSFNAKVELVIPATWYNQELVIVRGLPGSGKSTIAKSLGLVGYLHHETDHFFMVNGQYQFDASLLQSAHQLCLQRVKSSLDKGFNCVVSNTFTRCWEMKPYVDAAKSKGVSVRVVCATGSWGNIHDVPFHTIEKMKLRWEPAVFAG